MKVAVCIGGIPRPESYDLAEKLKKKFSTYDFFFGVWKGRKDNISEKLQTWSFEEHTPIYHPYIDIDAAELPWKIKHIQDKMSKFPEFPMIAKSLHQTKQILMHSYMLDMLPQEYDMIIRTRYDVELTDNSIDFESLVDRSYKDNHAIGFSKKYPQLANMFNPKDVNGFHQWWEGHLMDVLLFHPRKLFNKNLMLKLHTTQKLLAAEFGWYQILSQPFGDNHQNYMCNMRITSREGKSQ